MSANAPRTLLLRVSFDVDQLGNELIWMMSDEESLYDNPYQRTGKAAGALQMEQYDILGFEVVAYGRPHDFVTFHVTDATLVTMPQAYVRPPVPPSPFDTEHATFDLDRFHPSTCHTQSPELRACTARSAQNQVVLHPIGVWKFSMVLTVRIERRQADGACSTEMRVFSFDPQIIVGPGVRTP